MPALSSTMKEGKIVQWTKAVGDRSPPSPRPTPPQPPPALALHPRRAPRCRAMRPCGPASVRAGSPGAARGKPQAECVVREGIAGRVDKEGGEPQDEGRVLGS
jgi:hypothetical protein